MAYLTHTSVAGERWDQLAYRYYGDANRTAPILEANRDRFDPMIAPIPSILPHGLELRIPVIEQAAIDQLLLPPWKRT